MTALWNACSYAWIRNRPAVAYSEESADEDQKEYFESNELLIKSK